MNVEVLGYQNQIPLDRSWTHHVEYIMIAVIRRVYVHLH